MSRYRIKRINDRYYPQKKFFGIFLNIRESSGEYIIIHCYDTEKDARKFICEQMIKEHEKFQKRKIVEIIPLSNTNV